MRNKFLCAATVIIVCSFALGQQYGVLWAFGTVPHDGSGSFGNLIFDHAGNLYGTTEGGGVNNGGTVFELSPNPDGIWSEKVLYNFCSSVIFHQCTDGSAPVAGLVFDAAGNLYGTTSTGGVATCQSNTGCGTAFELTPTQQGTWTETILYNFCSDLVNNRCLDGVEPRSQLIFDGLGNLYGTTTSGGTGNNGRGTIFELSLNAGQWTHTVLYTFCADGQGRICPDGDEPQAGVTFDAAGNLYGTTMSGGAKNSQGTGTVYELSPGANGWTETVVFAFSPSGRGLAIPVGTASFGPNGNLYSTASEGFPGGGVFELEPKTRTERHFLFNISDGSGPVAGVVVDSKRRAIYGTTVSGGSALGGTVFVINASGQETVLYNFCQQAKCSDGQYPYAGLIKDAAGILYGTASAGGMNDGGVVFEITP